MRIFVVRGQDPETAQQLLTMATNTLQEDVAALQSAAPRSVEAVGVAAKAAAQHIAQV